MFIYRAHLAFGDSEPATDRRRPAKVNQQTERRIERRRCSDVAIFSSIVVLGMALIAWSQQRIETRSDFKSGDAAREMRSMLTSAALRIRAMEEKAEQWGMSLIGEEEGGKGWGQRRRGEEEEEEEEEEEGGLTLADLFPEEEWHPVNEKAEVVDFGVVAKDPTGTSTLGEALNPHALPQIWLHDCYKEAGKKDAVVAEVCDGPLLPCPTFAGCGNAGGGGSGRGVLAAQCEIAGLAEESWQGKPPLNVAGSVETQKPYDGLVFLVENVYVDAFGTVFNATHSFRAGGCPLPAEDSRRTFSANTKVTQFALLASLAGWHGGSYFYALFETLPDLILLHPILTEYPDVPLVVERKQLRDSSVFSEAGFQLSSLNTYSLSKNGEEKEQEVFFAEQLILPARQWCSHPGRKVVQRMQKYLKAKVPPPLRPDFDPTNIYSRYGGNDWQILVLSVRPEGSPEPIAEQLASLYTPNRVATVWGGGRGDMGRARALFGTAILVIGEHTDALSHILFMRPRTAVLEIRSEGYENRCFHYLADRLFLDYYLMRGRGKARKALIYDVREVVGLVKTILPIPAEGWAAKGGDGKEEEEVGEGGGLGEAEEEEGGGEGEGEALAAMTGNAKTVLDIRSDGRAVIRGYHNHSIGWGHLGTRIAFDSLTPLILHSNYVDASTNGTRAAACERVTKLECPHFAACANKDASLALGSCQVARITDAPIAGKVAMKNRGGYAEGSEAPGQLAFEGHVFLLENVFVNAFGVVFNRTHVFRAGGCLPGTKPSLPTYSAATKVSRYDVLTSLVSVSGGIFYHSVTELLGNLYLIDTILKTHPHLPVLMESWQRNDAPLLASAGHPSLNVKWLNRKKDAVAFATLLLLPAHPRCGRPPESLLWASLGKYLGVERPDPLPEADSRAVWELPRAKDWVVLVMRRVENDDQDLLLLALQNIYGYERVMQYRANPSVADKEVFGRAVVIVGEHSQGFTNMIFMRPGCAVVEIRPDKYQNQVFHYLADRMHLQYYMVAGKGARLGKVEADLDEVVGVVKVILPRNKIKDL